MIAPAFVVAAVVTGLCVWLCAAHERALMSEARARVELLTTSHARALSEAIASRLASLRGLRAFAMTELDHTGTPERLGETFPAFVAPLLRTQDGIRNFSVAPDAVQRWVYPLVGNEGVIGHDLLNDPRPGVAASTRRALASDDIVITGPYQLRQGGLGLVARLAVRRDGRAWGVVAMVLDLPPMLAAAGLGGDGRLDFALLHGDGEVFAGSPAVLERQSVVSSVRLPEGEWRLAAVPRSGWDAVIAAEVWQTRAAAAAVVAFAMIGLLYAVRCKARAVLRASERRFRDLADISADWFWEMDVDLRLTHCSPGFAAIGGVDPATLLGRSFADIAAAHIRCIESLSRTFKARQAFRNIRIVWGCPGGRVVHLDVSGMPVYDEDGQYSGYRGTGRDATTVVAALAEVQAATEARAAAEAESRAKSAFLARMSHELRTPLNAILGFSDAMVSGVFGAVQPARYHDYAVDIHRSGQHLRGIISDLLDLAQIEAGRMEIKPQTVTLPSLLDEVAVLAAPLAAHRRNRLEVGRVDDRAVCVDDARVRQVLLNLVGNACKFTSDGVVRLSAEVEDARIVFRVADTGVGIAADDLPKLFRDFSQLEAGRARPGEGTGLGLSICRHLCRLMGGDVVAESEAGRGSVFTVTLPVTCPVRRPVTALTA